MSHNVIELNGKRYDASTGKFLGPADKASATGKAIDGIVGPISLRATLPAKPHQPATTGHSHHVPVNSETHVQHHGVGPHHEPARPAHAHERQHTKTLMRHAVHRPDNSFKRHLKVETRTDLLVKTPTIDLAPKLSINSVDKDRLKRAKHIARSKLVSRFGNILLQKSATTVTKSVATAATSLPVAIKRQPEHIPAKPMLKQPSTDIFERALAQANSHKQPAPALKHSPKKGRRVHRALGMVLSSLAVIFIIGFIGYQNIPNVQIRLAASKAGIDASLPRWQPSGFKIGKLMYGPGTVTVNFIDTSASHSFSLIQTASNWDTTALLNNYVLLNNNTFNTVESAGSTIYTYGNNNATWVNGGIWYKLTTNGALSTSQIVNIATSL